MKKKLVKQLCVLIAIIISISIVFSHENVVASANEGIDNHDEYGKENSGGLLPRGPIFSEDLKDDEGGGQGEDSNYIFWDCPIEHIAEFSKFATFQAGELFSHRYVNSIKSAIPTYTSNVEYRDVDTLLYTINEMQEYVFNSALAEEIGSGHYNDVNNQMLGFLRCINKNYSNQKIKWNMIAGSGFSSFINEMSDVSISAALHQYLFRFIPYNTGEGKSFYNDAEFCVGIPTTLRNLYKAREQDYIIDPCGSPYGIDLTHMFASMDGIFDNTGRTINLSQIPFGEVVQKDAISWMGDLYTLASSISSVYETASEIESLPQYDRAEGFIDFNEYVTRPDKTVGGFSAEDLNADIDAFNIATMFLDSGTINLVDSMLLYYNSLPSIGNLYNRYTLFVYTCTRNTTTSNGITLVDKFRNKVYNSMNLAIDNNGTIYEVHYHDLEYIVLDKGYGQASLEARKYCAQLFCDYILYNANLL